MSVFLKFFRRILQSDSISSGVKNNYPLMNIKYGFDMLMLTVVCLYAISINSHFGGSAEFLKLQYVLTVQ